MENTKRNISIWIDKDLARIIKNQYNTLSINKELEYFLQKNNPQINSEIEITLDSLTETKTIMSCLNKLNDKVNELYQSIKSLRIKVTDIGIEVVCDYEYTDDNACDCLSDYFGTFGDSKQQIQKRQKEENLENLIKEYSLTKQIEQMIKSYQIDEKNLNLYNNNKQIIEFLLDYIKSNQEMVQFLTYKQIYNKQGKPYKINSIAKKRYRYKKNKISRNDI